MHSSLIQRSKFVLTLTAPLLLAAAPPRDRLPDAHKWEVAEVFSNADGTVQFIEWFNTDPDENLLSHESMTTGSGSFFAWPNDLPSPDTRNRRFLMATAAFAALPGAPAPDYIMPDGFLNPGGDSIDYSGGDFVSFGALPTDGTTSRSRNGALQVNSPTNFAGVAGSIDASTPSASFVTFGAGCAHDPASPVMSVGATAPVLGGTFAIAFADTPSPAVIALLGLSTTVGFGVAGTPPLPFDLSGFGLPGCSLLVSADIDTVFLPTGIWTIPIPNQPLFAGLALHVQGFSEAPGANPIGFVVSDAGTGVIGN
ncbi:MAG: hypothetical protein AB7O97_07960 [Planctomycetota bacterium]